MLDKIITAVAVGVILVAVAFGVKVQRENNALREDLAASELRLVTAESNLEVKNKLLAQAIAARATLQTHLDRTAADAAHWEQVASDLLEKDGADEALNDYERGVLDRLLAP